MRRLAGFLVVSLLGHLLMLYGVPLHLPQPVRDSTVITARLAPASLPAPRLVQWPRVRQVRARTAQPAIASAPLVYSAPAAQIEILQPQGAAPAASAQPAALDAAPPPLAAEAAAPAPAAVEQPIPAAAPAIVARRLPRKGEIDYALYLGSQRFQVGRTVQTWELSDDGYTLTSHSETTGLAAIFVDQRISAESRGKLTAGGLQPERFINRRVRSGRSEDVTADFNWNAMQAAIGDPRQSLTLPTGTQDMLSFMYQLGLMPLSSGLLKLSISNGWKLEQYELEVGAEVSLDTPMGTLRALPVKQVHGRGQETIELWLAPAYRLLPVRIMFFDRDGEFAGEQVVTDIRVSKD